MESSENLLPALLIIAVGIFAICGAYFQWNWFMSHRKATFIQKLFGRNGTRIFYSLLGLVLIGLGTMILLGYDTISISQ